MATAGQYLWELLETEAAEALTYIGANYTLPGKVLEQIGGVRYLFAGYSYEEAKRLSEANCVENYKNAEKGVLQFFKGIFDLVNDSVQHTDRKGTVTETKYNVYGQPVLQTCIDQKGNRYVMGTWEYDDFGQMKKSVAGGFAYIYDYRPDGKLLKKWSSGNLSHLQIGNKGNENLLYDAFVVYDLMNRLTEEDHNGAGERYAYDLCGNRLTREQYRNGSVDAAERYKYNERNELAERVREGSFTIYSYDKNGSLVRNFFFSLQ